MAHARRLLLTAAVLTATGCGTATPIGGAKAAGTLAAQGKAAAKVSAAIDDLFSGLQVGETPGAAVAVLHGGQLLHQKGYGTADLATRRPVTPETTFDLGAVSMSFTALAVMTLAERGVVRYDEPLATYFPQFAGQARAITIRHLLNHTAGLPDYRPLYEAKVAAGAWPAGYAPTSKEILALAAEQKTLDFTPGADFAVSNTGYVVLAQVVEKVTRTPFPAFMKTHVFKPLQMPHAYVADGTRRADAQRARSYAFQDGAYQAFGPSPFDRLYGDGGVNAPIADMAKWSSAYKPGTLVGAANVQAATTPPELTSGGRSHYGFGLLVKRSTAGDDMLMHAGQTAGFRAAALTRPERGFAVVVLSNTKDTAALALADEIMQQVVTR